MRTILTFFLFTFVLSLSQHANATNERLPSISGEQSIVRGLQSVEKNQWQVGERQLTQTSNALSADLYYWLRYTADNKSVSFNNITQFLRAHKDWPRLTKIQITAEKAMPENYSVDDVLRWFDEFEPKTDNGVERYADALLARNRRIDAKKLLSKWWRNELAGADTQRAFYGKYQQLISLDDNKERLRLLLGRGYTTAARNLSAVMPAQYQGYTNARIALSQNKGDVNPAINRVSSALRKDEGFLYDRLKWRRQKNLNSGMVEILAQQPYATQLHNPYAWWKERHILIRRYIDLERYGDAYKLAAGHRQKSGLGLSEAEFIAGWMALNYLKKPKKAFQHFKNLYEGVETPISKARGAYWAGLAADKGGNKSSAQNWYKVAAQNQPGFYGVLSNNKLINPIRFSKIGYSSNDWNKWARDERAQAAILLYRADLVDESLSFFLKMASENNISQSQFGALITFADVLGDTRSSVKVYKKAARQGYPMRGYGYPLRKFSNMAGLPPAAVHAIIRQESEFNPKAISHANARGLMQLLPSTANSTARRIGKPYQKSWLTTRSDYNVTLGSAYFKSLLVKYDGAIPLAAAAYNAGPGRVTEWIRDYGDPRTDYADPLNWMEKIPFSETRNYVQRVLEGYYAYNDLAPSRQSSVKLRTLVD